MSKIFCAISVVSFVPVGCVDAFHVDRAVVDLVGQLFFPMSKFYRICDSEFIL